MDKKFHFIVSAGENGERIDKYLASQVDQVSRTMIQELIEEGLVVVNTQQIKANYKVQLADEIDLTIPRPKEISAEPENIPIDIIYEDEFVGVVNKPSGMVVHPSPGHPSHTLVNALLYHMDSLSGISGKIRPGIVHRIDKDTSGLLMVAKNDQAHQSLSEQLKQKTSLREYIALVHGNINHQKGTIKAPLGRDPNHRQRYAVRKEGKKAVTHFELIERFDNYSLLKLRLETGRTHQIRVHMDYINYPLVGDPTYGPRKTIQGNGQFLHARKLGFNHPDTGEWMEFESEVPPFFNNTLEELRKVNDLN